MTQEMIQHIETFFTENYLQVKVTLAETDENNVYAFYVYKGGDAEAIAKSPYKKFDTYQLEVLEAGEYRVKVFVKNTKTGQVVTKTSERIRKTIIVEY
ncbi:hypothetical protein BMT55_02300 [Listeria newyorkensis]|uniref:Two component regulator three Y domain-containing protein n=1 Tax=Listeria newyorkensis TaxID=1497681 RepID=A0ABX4XQN6_9LIST|nr:hypothetical protein [Listeria newyorkensis]KGL38224.1 hypothetical protein EP58_15815 [Listeria newyorkensis]PNP94339.1 hypothetical protein BMT55_02300 [Listeria newyorkensis]WAO22753.1 hypothetical protein OTR81_05640 [Listeria newyorkensis]SQC54156.1 Uncharacterised protein [Listeria newyorkensis]